MPSETIFTLPESRRTTLKTMTLRETRVEDEYLAAAAAARVNDGRTADDELVRRAIVAVDGDPVVQPFLDFDTWNTATLGFAVAKFKEINGVTADELAQLLKTEEECGGRDGKLVCRFCFDGIERVDLQSITLRETDGKDGYRARHLAQKAGPGVTAYDELLRLGVVAVDDTEVGQPFAALDQLSTRTRQFLQRAFTEINSLFL
jgi:hypothetical protein